MTEDYLSKVLESAYSNTICEWQAQGISDKEIIDKINQKTDGSRHQRIIITIFLKKVLK